ncbi:MAG: SDR family oxidoreductase [Acidobacteria bacterium]|nr:SDR family oxidoreductase [Acidobacteriota bacterium]
MDLDGKSALVTGASRGIGRAVALRLARSGARVAVNHRSAAEPAERRAREVLRDIEALGGTGVVIRADIALRDEIRRMADAVREGFGRLDLLVLNAARAPFKPLERLLEKELRELTATNFTGNILCVREMLPLMGPGGKIVFVSSLGSRFHSPSYPLGPMKAAMEAAVRDLAEGLAPRGIAVNGVCGGIVKTDAFKTLRLVWEGLDRVPEALVTEPEELADVVHFLCTDAARGVRGQTLTVDRGLSNRLRWGGGEEER